MLRKTTFLLLAILFSIPFYSQTYKIYIKPHIVTDDMGNNGVSEQYADLLVSGAEDVLNGAGLSVDLEKLPADFIKSTAYLDLVDDEFDGLTALVSDPSVYHLFIVRTFKDNYGKVTGIPSNKIVVGEAVPEIRYETLAHELGHCFNLYHTYHEDPEGEGDFVEDTPEDNVFIEIDLYLDLDDCIYTTKGEGVNDDSAGILIHNLMSIGKIEDGIKKCDRHSLTPDQRSRVNAHLNSQTGISVNMVKVTAENDFGGGFIKNNSIDKPSPVILVEASGQTVNFEAFDQNFDENDTTYKRLFQKWEGNYPSEDNLIIPPIGSFPEYNYTARFLKEFNVTLNNGPYYVDGTYENNSTVIAKVVQFNSTSVSAGVQQVNGIDFVFESWNDNGSTTNSRTITPNAHQQYTVSRKGYANTSVMNIHFTHSLGENITLEFNDHPDANVIQYKVYRKVKNVPGVTLLKTLNRGAGTHTVTDGAYKATNGTGSKVLMYNVQAYYNVDQTWSDPEAYDYTVGEQVVPEQIARPDEELTAVLKTAERENSISGFPNPFNPASRIEYSIKEDSDVKIVVYNVLGQKLRTLVDEHKEAGAYFTKFNASNLPSGIYYCKIVAGGFVKTIKLLLSK